MSGQPDAPLFLFFSKIKDKDIKCHHQQQDRGMVIKLVLTGNNYDKW
jgi:hypothetical protein